MVLGELSRGKAYPMIGKNQLQTSVPMEQYIQNSIKSVEAQSPMMYWPPWTPTAAMSMPTNIYTPPMHDINSFVRCQNPTTPNPGQRNGQRYRFIDQTPTNPPISLQEIRPAKKQKVRSVSHTIDLQTARVSQRSRREQKCGNFTRRLEDLERQLQEKQITCEKLRNTLNCKDMELEALQQHFHRVMEQRNQEALMMHYPSQYAQTPPASLQTTGRNAVLMPSPNPMRAPNRKAFMEKIDYTKVPLRKTDQLDEEKRDVIILQEEWEERQRVQSMITKMEAEANWQAWQFQPPIAPTPPYYGGGMSNIYPETQNKVGNFPVPAFTTKVDLNRKREGLSKKNECSLEKLLLSDSNPNTARISMPSDDLFHRISSDHGSGNGNVFKTTDSTVPIPTPVIDLLEPIEVPQTPLPQTVPLERDISPRSIRILGGPPSNIYPPPEKIGNLQVPAFTTKIDYSEVPLRRTDSRD